MEDLPVGAEITLKVVETDKDNCNGCTGCFFDEISISLYDNVCNHIKCSSNERKDKKNVQFVRVK